jgi:serine protease inhibitor
MARAGGAPPPETTPLEVKADRPFLFTIRSTSGAILFMGRITDPTQAVPL